MAMVDADVFSRTADHADVRADLFSCDSVFVFLSIRSLLDLISRSQSSALLTSQSAVIFLASRLKKGDGLFDETDFTSSEHLIVSSRRVLSLSFQWQRQCDLICR